MGRAKRDPSPEGASPPLLKGFTQPSKIAEFSAIPASGLQQLMSI
jgi:hypothetical protein